MPALRLGFVMLVVLALLSSAACSRKAKTQSPGSASKVQISIGSPSPPSGSIPPDPGTGVNWDPTKDYKPADKYPSPTLFNLINDHRTKMVLSKLKWHGGLRKVAIKHADAMTKGPAAVTPDGVDVYTRLVSSKPAINFTRAYAIPLTSRSTGSYRARATKVFNALLANPAGKVIIEDPTWTHFGARFHNGAAVLIFGQNVTP